MIFGKEMKKMKKQFTTPVIEVLKFASEDVILTASTGDIDIDIWGSSQNDNI